MSSANVVKNAASSIPRRITRNFLSMERPDGEHRMMRSIGTNLVKTFTPFLVFNHHQGSDSGFPDHPHRGQETITYILKAYVDHEDFTGARGRLGPGDLQFMTAGKGIVHAEMPKKDEEGNSPDYMQIWVDLPKELKAAEPRYRDLKGKDVPIARPNDKVEVKVISGESYGVSSPQDLVYTPVVFYDVRLKPGGKLEQPIPKDFNMFLYNMEGTVKINGEAVPQWHTVLFEPDGGESLEVTVDEDAEADGRFLIFAGKPLDQEIVQMGPFVETTQEDAIKAFMDFQTGQNGFEKSAHWTSEIGKA